MPLKAETVSEWTDDANGTTYAYKGVLCSDLGCIVETPNVAGSNQDQVRLVPLCEGESEWGTERLIYPGKCTNVSNSSVLVLSIARQLATDDNDEGILDWSDDNTEWFLTLNNPRVTFQVTVGRLSWSLVDLTSIYDDSVCLDSVNCRGLYFPLADGKRHVLVGEEHVPMPQNTTFTDPDQWQKQIHRSTIRCEET